MSTGNPKSNAKRDQPLWRRLLAFAAALVVLGIGVWLLVDLWGGTPTAAAFTRVGGETHVETALEAARFWTPAPTHVVTVAPGANKQTILRAAQCAMTYDAPLLFDSADPKRQRMVDAAIASWRLDPIGREVTQVDNNKPCTPDNTQADVKGLSAYGLQNNYSEFLLPLPRPALVQERLAPVVVFAAEWAPEYPPDIAVGLALAAHMAQTYSEVSLVVVPRYVEADRELDTLLRDQRKLVMGGVILGDQKILSEDTRALLRQLLTSTDRQGFLGEMRTTLGSVEPLVAALLALLGLGTAYVTRPRRDDIDQLKVKAGELRNQARKLRKRVVKSAQGLWEFIVNRIGKSGPYLRPTLAAWLGQLGKDQERSMTIRLISGWEVTGIIDHPNKNDARTATVVRLNVTNPPNSAEGGYVLLRVEDIESIRVVPQSPDGSSVSKEDKSASSAEDASHPRRRSSRPPLLPNSNLRGGPDSRLSSGRQRLG